MCRGTARLACGRCCRGRCMERLRSDHRTQTNYQGASAEVHGKYATHRYIQFLIVFSSQVLYISRAPWRHCARKVCDSSFLNFTPQNHWRIRELPLTTTLKLPTRQLSSSSALRAMQGRTQMPACACVKPLQSSSGRLDVRTQTGRSPERAKWATLGQKERRELRKMYDAYT